MKPRLKPSTKRSHERSSQLWNKGLSIGSNRGDEEDEGETEEQKKKRQQEEHQGKEMAVVQTTLAKEVKKIEKRRLLVQRFPPQPATEHPNLDQDACLRALSMSTAHDEDIDQDLHSEDEEEELSNGEKSRRVDTFVATSRKEISISHCYSKEKHPQRTEDCVIETSKMPVKLGLTTKKHIVTQNAVMEQEGYEAKKEVKRLKKELTASKKVIKEFQKISTTPLHLQKQTSFHEGWELMKEQLKNEVMEAIKRLSSPIYKLLIEGVEIRDLKA